MKTILVTSDITYVPNNYDDVISSVLERSHKDISGVVLVKVSYMMIIRSIASLYFCGCKKMAYSLTVNLWCKILFRKQSLLKKFDVPYISVQDVNEEKCVEWIETIDPDLLINMRARSIYGEKILQLPHLGCINVHHGLLPRQRGLFCDLQAMGRDEQTGFTIHKMSHNVDDGRILSTHVVDNNNNYLQYLTQVASEESSVITCLIDRLSSRMVMLVGVENYSQNSIITTTPSYHVIKKLQRKGIKI